MAADCKSIAFARSSTVQTLQTCRIGEPQRPRNNGSTSTTAASGADGTVAGRHGCTECTACCGCRAASVQRVGTETARRSRARLAEPRLAEPATADIVIIFFEAEESVVDGECCLCDDEEHLSAHQGLKVDLTKNQDITPC